MKSALASTLVLAAGVTLSPFGCVDAGDSLQILQNQVPGEGCIVNAQSNNGSFPRGIIDVNAKGGLPATRGYLFTPLVQNRAAESGSATRIAIIDGANVDLEFETDFYSDGEIDTLKDDGLSSFRQAFSGSIPAGGQGSFGFEVIPREMLESLAGKLGDGESTVVFAKVEIVGELDGGKTSSPIFRYPIEVCNGCLTVSVGECATFAGEADVGGVCQPLQDGYVSCCTDPGGGLVCPALAAGEDL